ncbi:MAG TPA: bifunctional UDP-N-acetylglucosamine diphosphorylase/glucosamine-1-phosphate N-acetyltransferase GlmU [Gammaproteobacteria bacterium]
MALTVVILAAGQGKRMNSARPKVLQPLAGRPMLAHVIDTARGLEPDAINVVYGHGGDTVRDAFDEAGLDWSLQTEQLGTGHAVAQALPAVPDDHQVLVLCGDVPLITAATLEPVVEYGSGSEVVVLSAILDNPHGYGRILRGADGKVAGIVEQKDASAEEDAIAEINTGIMRLPADRLRDWLESIGNDNSQGEFYLTDAIGLAVEDGVDVAAIPAGDATETHGINDRSQLAAAERALQRRHAKVAMAAGATLADPDRFDVRGTLAVGQDVFIDVGAVFEGEVRLGDGVSVGPNCVISDTTLGDGCIVHPNSVLHGVIAGPRCEIGPFARLRPGTEFAEQVKIGNFVEVKASDIAPGSKVNHLSYVGDTSVGTGVNIGAGTIVCNYDGARKHRSSIGDGAFIGSGVMLVAPVEVGEGATIGAGSIVTKQAPAGELTIARARQTVIKGWKRPQKPAK